jgi:hypothetical protein
MGMDGFFRYDLLFRQVAAGRRRNVLLCAGLPCCHS